MTAHDRRPTPDTPEDGIVDRVATAEEHAALAAAVNWESHFDDELRAASLAASIAGVVYVERGRVVGMARAIGDGLQYAYIQDVIVHPDHDGSGVGTRLVERLMELLHPIPGTELFVGLFASPEARSMYDSLGFSSDEATGMHRRLAG